MVKAWNELSVLIAGCGSIGKRHARVLKSLQVTDIRACDPVPEQRQALSAQMPTVRTYDSLRSRPSRFARRRLHLHSALDARSHGPAGDRSRLPRPDRKTAV